MKPGDMQPVIDKYLEDRGGLTEDEMGGLINALQVDRNLAVRVKEQMLLDEMLRQKLAADGRHFSAQVAQRIRDHQSGELGFEHKTVELHEQIERALIGDIHGLSSGSGQAGKRIRRRKYSRLWPIAVLLLVGASSSIALVGWNSQQNRAVIGQTEGEVLLVRQGRLRPLAAMAEVRDGDRFETSASGKLVLRYHDGTTVKINGKTKATFRTGWSKEITISEGNISADVIPQQFAAAMKFRTPVADALVLGTKLRITAREGATRLDVSDGAVNLTRTSGGDSVRVDAGHYGIATDDDLYAAEMRWPAAEDGLVFHTSLSAEKRQKFAAPTGTRLFYPLRPEGKSRIDEQGRIILKGGHVRPAFATDAADDLLQACRLSGELAIECVLRTQHLQQGGPGRIVTFSTDSANYNFSLRQQDDRIALWLRVAGGEASPGGEVSLCHLVDHEPHHLVVSCREGLVMCFLDGEKVCENNSVAGSFMNWQPQTLLLGNDSGNDRPWKGELRAVALYSRFLSRADAVANRRRLQQAGVCD